MSCRKPEPQTPKTKKVTQSGVAEVAVEPRAQAKERAAPVSSSETLGADPVDHHASAPRRQPSHGRGAAEERAHLGLRPAEADRRRQHEAELDPLRDRQPERGEGQHGERRHHAHHQPAAVEPHVAGGETVNPLQSHTAATRAGGATRCPTVVEPRNLLVLEPQNWLEGPLSLGGGLGPRVLAGGSFCLGPSKTSRLRRNFQI